MEAEDRRFYRVISEIYVVLREATLTTPDSIQTGSPGETEIVRVVSFIISEITEITQFKGKKKRFKGGPSFWDVNFTKTLKNPPYTPKPFNFHS